MNDTTFLWLQIQMSNISINYTVLAAQTLRSQSTDEIYFKKY
jgi:hypothetical protein